MLHLNIKITGKVQGVFFRASAKDVADQLSVKGFAQNKPDGSVYIEAEGDDETLNQFVEWCKKGPIRANVTQVDVHEAELVNFGNFQIKR